MLIPRFSLRFLLFLTTLCALFFYVVTLAIQGSQWATAVSVALSGLLLCMMVQAGTFGVAWGLTSVFGLFRRGQAPTSPFAASRLPPHVVNPLPPEE